MRKLIIMLVVVLFGFGCSVRQTGFTVISTKNVELSSVDLKEIPLSGNPKLEDAVDMCLKDGDGDFIINPIITSRGWSLLLFSYGSWHIRGDVGNSLVGKLPEQRMPPSDQYTDTTIKTVHRKIKALLGKKTNKAFFMNRVLMANYVGK